MTFARAGLFVAAIAVGTIAVSGYAMAQTPKRGGSITIGIEGEGANFDCHASASNLVLAYMSSTQAFLLRYDYANYPKIVGDLATGWTVSPDGLTYTVKLHPNVKFHDGAPLTSEDIKATYDRIRKPPTGVVSARAIEYTEVTAIETPDPTTVVFKLSERNAAFLSSLASPYNCVYSARRLAANPNAPQTDTVGAGPFQFVEYVKGSHWIGKRFDGYFRPGLPYLDGFKVVVMSTGAPVNALSAGQIDANFRSMTPQELERIYSARGDKVKGTTLLINTPGLLTFNLKKKPFDDVRVRKAITMAIDRRGGLEPIKKITNMLNYGGLSRPGAEYALPESELHKLPGFGEDIAAARQEARRLLAEAGQSNLQFKLGTRNQVGHWTSIPVFVIDQLRQIGVNAELDAQEATTLLRAAGNGTFDVFYDTNGTASDDPSQVLGKYLPGAPLNFGKIEDPMLTELFAKQRATTTTDERRRLVTEFEKRTLGEVYTAPLYWAGLTAILSSDIRGWYATPSSHLGYTFTEVWRE